jgi:hypothetical protein
MYIKAKCSGISNPTFYFKFNNISIDEAKKKIDDYFNSFIYLSISCSEENKTVLESLDEEVKGVIDLEQ